MTGACGNRASDLADVALVCVRPADHLGMHENEHETSWRATPRPQLHGVNRVVAAIVAGARVAGHTITRDHVSLIWQAATGQIANPRIVDMIYTAALGDIIGPEAAARTLVGVQLAPCEGQLPIPTHVSQVPG